MSKEMAKFQHALISGTDRKVNEQLERFGVEGYSHGRTDRGSNYRSAADVKKDLTEAARNDYDLRRTLEAAAMSGKAKAQKILDSGFKKIGDINNATNFQRKAAKRHGQGGQFSSAKDMMGLTQSMVERDRRKLMEDIEAMQPQKEKKKKSAYEKAKERKAEYDTLSPARAKDFAFVDAYEARARGEGDYSMSERYYGSPEVREAAAQEFSDNYKTGVKKRLSPSFKMDKIFT